MQKGQFGLGSSLYHEINKSSSESFRLLKQNGLSKENCKHVSRETFVMPHVTYVMTHETYVMPHVTYVMTHVTYVVKHRHM